MRDSERNHRSEPLNLTDESLQKEVERQDDAMRSK